MQSNHAALFREYLVTSNLTGIRKLWAHIYPEMPQPNGDFEVQVVMHIARTQAESVPLTLRLYSHQWLRINGQADASQLPELLKPMAERTGGAFVKGVGIAVVADDPAGIMDPVRRAEAEQKQHIGRMIQKAMGAAVEDAMASGHTDTGFLRQRMDEARNRTLRHLGGPQIRVAVTHDFSGLHVR